MHASTAQRFEDAYRTISERLRLLGCHDPDVDVLRLVRNWLCDEANGRWLMVLDNADDGRVFFEKRADNRQPLAGYLPQAEHGSILVTSRSRDAAARLASGHRNVIAVEAMDDAQALRLLRCKLGNKDNDPTAAKLICAPDRVPLAITQVAAYIVQRAPRMSLGTYLKTIKRNKKKKAGLLGKDMGDLRRDVTAHNSIIATWQITFDAIREERASAADLLAPMSFFNSQGIPDWILRRHEREKEGTSSSRGQRSGDKDGDSDSDGSDRSSDSDAFEDDLHILRQYSLVATTLDDDVQEMHPMVQFCTQEWLASAGRALMTKRAFFRLMSREYPMWTYENLARCRALDPHIGPFEEGEPGDEEEEEDMAEVLTCAGYYRSMMGSYQAAEGMLWKAVRLREQIRGAEHPSTLTSVDNLGLVLRSQGKYSEAEEMLRRAGGPPEGAGRGASLDAHERQQSWIGAAISGQVRRGRADGSAGAPGLTSRRTDPYWTT